MTILVTLAAAALAAWMAWRGWRRGAMTMFVGWLPAFAAVGALLLMLRTAWSHPRLFGTICSLGCLAAVAAYAAAALALRKRQKTRGGDRPAAPIGRVNRAAGAALGVVHAAALCLGLACLGATASFAISLGDEPGKAGSDGSQTTDWAGALRRASRRMADIANFGVLRYVPGVREYSREIRCLVTILNAPSDRLEKIAEKRGIIRLADVPEVRAALDDREYLELIARVGRGSLAELPRLARSPRTKTLLACPQIRELTRTLRPSDLVRDLEELSPKREE